MEALRFEIIHDFNFHESGPRPYEYAIRINMDAIIADLIFVLEACPQKLRKLIPVKKTGYVVCNSMYKSVVYGVYLFPELEGHQRPHNQLLDEHDNQVHGALSQPVVQLERLAWVKKAMPVSLSPHLSLSLTQSQSLSASPPLSLPPPPLPPPPSLIHPLLSSPCSLFRQ